MTIDWYKAGFEAYEVWFENGCKDEIPVNPCLEGTEDHSEWEIGFDNAMYYPQLDEDFDD